MVNKEITSTPPAALARIDKLVGELRSSRSNVEGFIENFLDRVQTVQQQVAIAEAKWQQGVESSSDDDEMEHLLLRLAEAEAAFERSKQEMQEERSLAHQRATEIDDDTRQLIDDLIDERDALHQELHTLQRVTD